MSPLALGLVLVSAFMHAAWNLMARGGRQSATCMWRALTITAVAGLAPAVGSELLARSLPPLAWACAFGSGAFCGLYYFGLTRAYAGADFTTVYPLVRAVPVLLVGLGDVAWGRHPTPAGWAGMGLVFCGCMLAPLSSLRDFAPRRYATRAVLLVLLAACGTVGYSLLDKAAAEVVRAGPASAARYGYVFFLVSCASYGTFLRAFGPLPARGAEVGWKVPAAVACLNYGAYWLVLWAYQLARTASYVLAFRQFSIVIGVLTGFALFRERGLVVRTAAALLITAGLVLIGLCGA